MSIPGADRQRALAAWLKARGLGTRLKPASSDASFRRYFRVFKGEESLIVMDAPPEREPMGPFLEHARILRALGLNAPEVLEADVAQGFALLSDLGETTYLKALSREDPERLYGDALSALAVLQALGPREGPPLYSEGLLLEEMQLFRDWYLKRHLGLELGEGMREVLDETCALLVENALEQPQVYVHRDYHSRNLMLARPNPGILDFQDAVVGPVTYDLVSLLRDCYIRWPEERIADWAKGYHALALQMGILREEDEARFLRWFDLMGVQRHLKATGIFARLWHRDRKPGYLKDIPRTLGYVEAVSARYPELSGLYRLVRGLRHG